MCVLSSVVLCLDVVRVVALLAISRVRMLSNRLLVVVMHFFLLWAPSWIRRPCERSTNV